MRREGVFSALALSFLTCCQGNVLIVSPERAITTNKIESWDDILMDLVLAELKNYLEINKETVISIPAISNKFEYNVIGIDFVGYFNTSEGSFTNPASIKRQGDVNITHSANKIIASMTVSFSQLEVSFPEYAASVVGISESGAIDVTIQQNAVYIEVTVIFIPHCVVSISKLDVTKMSGIMVNMSGLGVLSPLESKIIAWILQSYKTTFTSQVGDVVRNKLQQELAKTKICKLKKAY